MCCFIRTTLGDKPSNLAISTGMCGIMRIELVQMISRCLREENDLQDKKQSKYTLEHKRKAPLHRAVIVWCPIVQPVGC